MQRIVPTLTSALVALTLATPAHATLNACAAAKKQCVAKKVVAILKCHTKDEKPPGQPVAKFTACVQKAKDKFDGGATPAKGCFAKVEAKFPGGCLTTNDVAALEATVDAFIDDAVCQLDAGSGTCPATPTPSATLTPTPTLAATNTPSVLAPTATPTPCMPTDPDPCGSAGQICGSLMDSCGIVHSCGVCAGRCCFDSCVCSSCACP